MNTIELVRHSVVSVSLPEPIVKQSASVSIVPIPSARNPVGAGLGILCGQWIFSCSHYLDSYATQPGDTNLFEAWCVDDPEIPRGIFASLYASSMDFLILAPDGMTVEMSEAGGTETSLEMAYSFEDKYGSGILPTEVVFAPGVGETKFSGFFFGPDGKAIHRTKFKMWRSSGKIEFYSNEVAKGCSGGPIFNDANQLIGLLTATSAQPDLNGLCHCWGNRIDQCMPRLLQHRINWNRWEIGSPQPDTGPDDPWALLNAKFKEWEKYRSRNKPLPARSLKIRFPIRPSPKIGFWP